MTSDEAGRVGIAAETLDLVAKARELASDLGLPLIGLWPPGDDAAIPPLVVVAGRRRIDLRETGSDAVGPVYVDFIHGAEGHRRTTLFGRQPLGRSVGRDARTVVDATAGLARDAFQLACLGYRVTAVERSRVLALLVRDGIERAREHGSAELRDALDRLAVVDGDAREFLASLRAEARPDVVYVDPMYPPTRKATPKKEMRLCRQLVGDDADAGDLLRVARGVATRRVVVKRHPNSQPLAPGATASIAAKQVRYDVYPPLP